MANDKKKPPPKKKQPPKKKSTSQNYGNNNKAQAGPLAKICLVIAVSDLLHALFFTVQAIIALVHKFSVFGMLALVGVIFWVIVVLLLLVGLCKRKPNLVRFWIIFSIAGFIADVLFLLWGISTSLTVDWDRLLEFLIVFIGIFIESTCIYVIHRYYKTMSVKTQDGNLCCGGKSKQKSNKDAKKKPRKK